MFIVIVGAGGFAREIQDIVYQQEEYRFVGFVDDTIPVGVLIHGSPVLGDLSWFSQPQGSEVLAVIGIGAPHIRRKVVKRLAGLGVQYATIIHPSVIKSNFVQIGAGSVICAGSILTNNIVIGEHVHLNLGTTVGHDAVLEDYVTTAPGVHINGRNRIGEGVYLGTGANFKEKVSVGSWSVIGAGAAVVSDIPENTTAVGCPAKVIKTRKGGWQDE